MQLTNNNINQYKLDEIEQHYKHDSKFKNYMFFYEKCFHEKIIDDKSELSANFKSFTKKVYNLNYFLKDPSSDNSREKDSKSEEDGFEEKANRLTKYVADILGYCLTNKSDKEVKI